MRLRQVSIGRAIIICVGLVIFVGMFSGGGITSGLLFGFLFLSVFLLALALVVGLIARGIGLPRRWWILLSGLTAGGIVLCFNIKMEQLYGAGVVMTVLFLLAGGLAGFCIRPKDRADTQGADKKKPANLRYWLKIGAACLITALAVAIMFPETVRPLGVDPGVFEDIQQIIRLVFFGQRDTAPHDL